MRYRDLTGGSTAPPRQPARIVGRGASMMACILVFAAAQAATFNVNSPADVPDATPGDGQCETATGNKVCTLRAAIQEANATPGADVINLQANATYLLTRVGIEDASVSGSLDISDSVDIVGAGPASTIVDGNGDVTNDRVFQVLACVYGSCAPNPVVVNMTGISIQHGKTSGDGGGLYAPAFQGQVSETTLTNCRVRGNASGGSGGGIFSSSTEPFTLITSVIADNTATSAGGGALFGVRFVVTDSTFSGNAAGTSGGGIYFAGGYGSISSSTISENHASEGGGGILSVASSSSAPYEIYVLNSTISGNSSDGNGGGLESAYGTANLYNVTIAGNTANSDRSGTGFGGGASNAAGATLNFTNSIIANNSMLITGSLFSTLNDCGGTITSQGYNIVTHPTCTVLGSYSTDAVSFGALQYNGGPTQTLALLPGSGGIDAGNPLGCTDDLGAPLETDQRGLPRSVGAACDLGAYEVQPNEIFADGFDP